ncbi:copper resistance protein NlpE [Alkaliflexus imshenetskii]|uniref:copper resistance protein NlpE n=1 Tax=Alkaliflexus imshenetskii TaxID=286730 RepID=UPI00047B2B5B|nr:copper resistance protein NlpE [Alkaliflexus imshenetskii]
MKAVFLLFPVLMLAFACKPRTTNQQVVAETPDLVVDMHNSRTSLDWAGTYVGLLPCASCSGILTELTLGYDETFILRQTWQGAETELTDVVSGTFSWNDAGSAITLNNVDGMPGHYFVGEGYLLHLDADGNRIQGELADHYRLTLQ